MSEEKQKLVTIESAAQICGWKLPKFEAMLQLPIDSPKRPKYLHVIEGEYLDLKEVEKYVKRSRERQLQAPIVTDETLLLKLEAVRRLDHGLKKAAIIALSSFAGLRVGEIASLKISDVMTDSGELKSSAFLYRDETKTRQAREIYLVHPIVKKYIEPYLKVRIQEKVKDKSPLFLAPRGGQFDGNNLQQYIKRVYKIVGLPKLSSHSGRAATAKRYLAKGKTLKFVGAILGHASTATTAKYDRVYNDEILSEMAEL